MRTVWLLVLALLAGGAVMVLELVAPRLAAPHVGTSALTWTVVIATFLAGLAAGNVAGGRLADRGPVRTLSLLFLAAAAVTASTSPLYDLATRITGGWSHGLRVLTAVPLAFLPCAFVLGTLPPVLAREVLARGVAPGWRIGAIGAAGALGSVGGTFAAGFVLVPGFGLRAIVLGVALTLALAAVASPRRVGVARATGASAGSWDVVLPRGWTALAVLAGAALLALEVVAGRVAADRLGSSLYTWTSVIGVVLSGLAIGAMLGGHLADRHAPRTLLRWLLLAASAGVLFALWSPPILDTAEILKERHGWSWASATLLTTTAAFLVPSILLGMITPAVIRAALADPATDGRVVGRLYAWGTAGAVVGAALVGYVLVPWVGTERLVLLLAFVLAIASGALRRRQPHLWHAVLLAVAFLLHGPGAVTDAAARFLKLREPSPSLYVTDSRYSRIRVRPVRERWVRLQEEPDIEVLRLQALSRNHAWWWEDRQRLCWEGRMEIPQLARLRLAMRSDDDRRAVERLFRLTRHEHRQLSLDRLIHGYVDLQDPTWLGYGYEALYDAVIQHLWPARDDVRCLFIGGGAFAFQRRLLAQHGEAFRCLTAEIDPEVTRTAFAWLGLVEDDRHRIVDEDARTYVEHLPREEGRFDFVFGDAFNDLAVPFHLTTQEFHEALKARMTPNGVYLVNVIDTYASGRFVGAFLGTLRATFRHVRLLSVAPRIETSRDTFVIAASDAPLHLLDLETRGADGGQPILYDRVDERRLTGRAGHLVLTDDFAPVETLLAPVVEDRVR